MRENKVTLRRLLYNSQDYKAAPDSFECEVACCSNVHLFGRPSMSNFKCRWAFETSPNVEDMGMRLKDQNNNRK